jgi:hypothetical protein
VLAFGVTRFLVHIKQIWTHMSKSRTQLLNVLSIKNIMLMLQNVMVLQNASAMKCKSIYYNEITIFAM